MWRRVRKNTLQYHQYFCAIEQGIGDAQAHIRWLHVAHRQKLAKLAEQEERLLDPAADGDLPVQKIRARLQKIQVERATAEQGLKLTGDKLALGARKLQQCVDLLAHPYDLYLNAPAEGRRDLNAASFRRIWLDDGGVRDSQQGSTLSFRLEDIFRVGSSKNVVVPPVGLEPTLSAF